MTKFLDYFLDRITMYRLVLYVLIGLIGMAAILAYVHQLSFSPLALLLSTAFLVGNVLDRQLVACSHL